MRFVNYPEYYNEEVYKRTVKKISKKYLCLVSSIYTFGGKVTPGISDIDFIMVMKEDTKKIPLNLRLFLLDKKAKYVISHPFFFIMRRDMPFVRLIYPNADLNLISGERVNIKSVAKGRFCELITSIELILRHFPRDYVVPLFRRRIDVRDMLLRLNSLSISCDAIERIGGKTNPEWDKFRASVRYIRKNWFAIRKKTRDKMLLELTRTAVVISLDLIENFNILLKEYVSLDGKKARYNGFQNKAVFVKDWSKDAAYDWIKKNKTYSLLPLEFSVLLFEYSKYSGPISGYIRKNLEGTANYDIKNKSLLKKRIEILNNQAILAERLKHSHFSAFIDFGYKTNAGLVNKAFNLVRKIKV